MTRVVIVGNSGAGKSTLAAALAKKTGLPLIASDPFYWTANWGAVSPEAVRQRVTDATATNIWAIDGNFDTDRDVVWARADTVVWLDYPLALVMGRVCRRNLLWWLTGQTVWSGSRMTWSRAWSGIHHARRTFAQKQAAYPAFLADFPHLTVLRFRSPHEAEKWILMVGGEK